MAAVKNRHIIFLGHLVDGGEKAQEVLLCVDVFLAMGGKKNVFAFFKAEPLVDVAGLNLSEVIVQNFGHRASCDVSPLFRESAVGKVTPCVLAVGHIHVADDVHNSAVGLLRETLVLATVAGFHMEYRDVEALGADYTKATVGVAENENRVWLGGYHQLVGAVDDVAASRSQIISYGIHINFWLGEFEVAKEDAVKIIIVVLACVGKNGVEICTAFVYHRRETYDFRAGADDDEEL